MTTSRTSFSDLDAGINGSRKVLLHFSATDIADGSILRLRKGESPGGTCTALAEADPGRG